MNIKVIAGNLILMLSLNSLQTMEAPGQGESLATGPMSEARAQNALKEAQEYLKRYLSTPDYTPENAQALVDKLATPGYKITPEDLSLTKSSLDQGMDPGIRTSSGLYPVSGRLIRGTRFSLLRTLAAKGNLDGVLLVGPYVNMENDDLDVIQDEAHKKALRISRGQDQADENQRVAYIAIARYLNGRVSQFPEILNNFYKK